MQTIPVETKIQAREEFDRLSRQYRKEAIPPAIDRAIRIYALIAFGQFGKIPGPEAYGNPINRDLERLTYKIDANNLLSASTEARFFEFCPDGSSTSHLSSGFGPRLGRRGGRHTSTAS